MLVTQHVGLFLILWTVVRQTPMSMEFSRQEYWSGLLFPIPGYLPDSGIESGSPALQAVYHPLIAQLLKNPPARQETPVQFLGQQDPMEKG